MARKSRIKVGVTYDIRTDSQIRPGDPLDLNAEFDHPLTIDAIRDAIRSGGYDVVKIGNVENLLSNLDKLNVDIIFNICEGMHGRNRESQVPVILELKNIPFVGTDGLSLGITLDKIIAKKIFMVHNIPTPNYAEMDSSLHMNGSYLNFPLIVKPRFEGSSKGLNNNSVVKNKKELIRQAKWVVETYKQPALVEEFISGKEFTIGIIGNRNPKTFPVVQVEIDRRLDTGDLFYTFSRIRDGSIRYICPAQVSKRMQKRLQELAIATYNATECRDFGRVDIRVDKKGNPYVLEINPLPSLSTADVFGIVGEYLGIGYNGMILNILRQALKRYGL